MFALVIRKIFHSGVPFKRIHILSIFSYVQKYLISIACNLCLLMVLFAMPTAIVLSQCTGIFGCGWPRSLRVDLKIIPSWQLRNNAPNSASAADATTKRKIKHSVWKAPLSVISFPSIGKDPMKKWPHALLRAFGSLRYDASEWMLNTMSDARNRMQQGGLPSNGVLGMLFPVYVPFLSFAHLHWYLTPLTPSYRPPACSKDATHIFLHLFNFFLGKFPCIILWQGGLCFGSVSFWLW